MSFVAILRESCRGTRAVKGGGRDGARVLLSSGGAREERDGVDGGSGRRGRGREGVMPGAENI